jgi:hypothetical protein
MPNLSDKNMAELVNLKLMMEKPKGKKKGVKKVKKGGKHE